MVDARNESQVASCSLDGSIVVWKIRQHAALEKLKHVSICEEGLFDMVYVPLTNSLVTIDAEKKVSYVNGDKLTIEKQLQAAYDGNLTSICPNDVRHEIAVGDEAGEIKVFNNTDGKLLFLDSTAHSAPVTSLIYSPDGQRLISGDASGRLIVWSANM